MVQKKTSSERQFCWENSYLVDEMCEENGQTASRWQEVYGHTLQLWWASGVWATPSEDCSTSVSQEQEPQATMGTDLQTQTGLMD